MDQNRDGPELLTVKVIKTRITQNNGFLQNEAVRSLLFNHLRECRFRIARFPCRRWAQNDRKAAAGQRLAAVVQRRDFSSDEHNYFSKLLGQPNRISGQARAFRWRDTGATGDGGVNPPHQGVSGIIGPLRRTERA